MTSKIYTKVYEELRGVDFSTEPAAVSPSRFAALENMYCDYESGGIGIETIPGYRRLATLNAPIHALHPSPDGSGLYLHAGTRLYKTSKAALEGGAVPTPVTERGGASLTLSDAPSRAVVTGGVLVLSDGVHLYRIKGTEAVRLTEAAVRPLLMLNGETVGQKNLLTDEGRLEYHLHELDRYAYYDTEDFEYSVSPAGVCKISRYTGSAEVLVLPPRATVGGREYAVAGVETRAFHKNGTVKLLIISEGIALLDGAAFVAMEALETLVLPESVTVIPAQCFDHCPMLNTLYMPHGVTEIGDLAFSKSPLLSLHFAGKVEDFVGIPGSDQLFRPSEVGRYAVYEESAYPTVRYRLPLSPRAEALTGGTLDGAALPLAEGVLIESGNAAHPTDSDESPLFLRPLLEKDSEGRIVAAAVYLEAPDASSLYGKTLSLLVRLFPALCQSADFAGGGIDGRDEEAVEGCRLLAVFDGRLFLSGNPRLPGVVFYTDKTPSGEPELGNFPEFHYIVDGDGRRAVTALLATPPHLLVMTDGTPTETSLFLHRGADTEGGLVGRVYPLDETVGGIGGYSATLFLGDTVLLSRRGLDALKREDLSAQRGLVHRSAAVDNRLLREELGAAVFFTLGTYLGIATEGRVYLADSRKTATRGDHTEYEWYYLSGIGSFRGDTPRYRYLQGDTLPAVLVPSKTGGAPLPLTLSPQEGYIEQGEKVYSFTDAEGNEFLYCLENGKAVAAYWDGEREGGEFSAATAFLEEEGVLYFGTGDGSLMVFNTDKRGSDGIIPRRYYSFADHAYRSFFSTKLDDCDLKTVRKSTVRSGGAVRLKSMTGGKVSVFARTEAGGFHPVDTLYGGRGDFSETDFATAEFHTGEDGVVPLREACHRWVEKQLTFVSDEYQRPFGILSVAYQYRAAGRI